MNRKLIFGILLGMAIVNLSAHAESETGIANWPKWRGPTANGVALEGNPPIEWGEDKNIKWKVKIPGSGHASPIVWDDKIFVLTAVPTGERAERQGETEGRRGFGRDQGPSQEYAFTVFCLDRESGEIIWERVARKEVPHEGLQRTNTYASGSPITDGERLFAFFGSRGLYCYDLNGRLIWEKDLGDMRTRLGFGEGTSPALSGNTVVVLWDNEDDSYVYAFDKTTGEELWRQPRDERTGWTTPYILEHDGRKQVVINATNAVRCYDLETGEVLWECRGQTANAIPSIVGDDSTVYAMSGFRGSKAAAITLGHGGDLTDSEAVRWQIEEGTPYVPSPLLVDGMLYFFNGNQGILSCVDAATGQEHFWRERISGLSGVYASPVAVANRVYLVGRQGTTVVLEQSEELKVIATNKLNDSIDASPAVVGDELLLRGHQYLYSIARE